jgi:hypothetical protein
MARGYFRVVFFDSLLIFAFGAANLRAQYAPPPHAYSISYTESLIMPNQQVTIYRDGNRVVTEEFTPRSGPMPHPTHTRDFINLMTHKEWTLDLQDPSVPCGVSTLGGSPGDWSGNPFEWLSFFDLDPSKLHPVGTDTVAGRKAQRYEMTGPGGQRARFWVDARYGLLLKMVAPSKGGRPNTILDVRSFTVGKPPASALLRPPACANKSASAARVHISSGPDHGEAALPSGIALPKDADLEIKWPGGSPLKLKPPEEVAFMLLANIDNLQDQCQLFFKRFCSLAELVRGTKTGQEVIGLRVNPARDENYHYALGISGKEFVVSAVPARPGLGGWFLVQHEFGQDCYFNPRGPATAKDGKKIGEYSFGADFTRH